jgi:hypothetical protein
VPADASRQLADEEHRHAPEQRGEDTLLDVGVDPELRRDAQEDGVERRVDGGLEHAVGRLADRGVVAERVEEAQAVGDEAGLHAVEVLVVVSERRDATSAGQPSRDRPEDVPDSPGGRPRGDQRQPREEASGGSHRGEPTSGPVAPGTAAAPQVSGTCRGRQRRVRVIRRLERLPELRCPPGASAGAHRARHHRHRCRDATAHPGDASVEAPGSRFRHSPGPAFRAPGSVGIWYQPALDGVRAFAVAAVMLYRRAAVGGRRLHRRRRLLRAQWLPHHLAPGAGVGGSRPDRPTGVLDPPERRLLLRSVW